MTDLRTWEATLDVDADAVAAAGAVEVIALPLNRNVERGGVRERIAPDALIELRDPGHLPMLWRHGELCGRWEPTLTRTETDVRASGTVSDTTLGRDVRTHLRDGSARGASIGWETLAQHMEQDTDGVTAYVHDHILLHEISITPLPALIDTAVLHAAEQKETSTMPDAPTLDQAAPQVDMTGELAAQIKHLETRVDQVQAGAYADEPSPHWSHQYGSAYEYATSVFHGDEKQYALDTALTGDAAGVVRAGWLDEVQRIVDLGRRGIKAFGTQPLPASGMTVSWPTYSAGTHVAAQSTQATEIQSVAVDLAAATPVNVATYAGGARNSWQLLRRSDPAYEPIWGRAMAAAYNAACNTAFATAVEAAMTDGSETVFDFDSGSETGTTLRKALVAASVDVEDATGVPAEFALVATDVFTTVAGYAGLPPAQYGAGANAEGAVSARTLRLEAAGIDVIRVPGLTDGTIIVSNSTAASWLEDGPMFASQEQVGVLSTDMAIYGFAVPAFFVPTGIINLKASYA